MARDYLQRLPALVARAPRWPTLKPPVPAPKLPAHLAIIMDGNGRWARRRGMIRVMGHQAGVESVRCVTRYCGQIGIRALTLYAFSTENWKRPRAEVSFLFRLLRKYLITERPELIANNVRLTTIGDISVLSENVQSELRLTQELTAKNMGLNLCLALNYGARDELLETVRTLACRVRDGELRPEKITADVLAHALPTAQMPELSLLIRTAGERRLSNFLLWQADGAQFHVTPVCWPDFRERHLSEAIIESAR